MRLAVTVAIAAIIAVFFLPGSATPLGVSRFRETQVTYFDRGNVPGDTEIWRTRVWLQHKFQTVGTGAIACINIDVRSDVRECQGTYVLPRGRIQVAGQIITRRSFQLTIVGGTGVYTGVGGTAIFTGLPNPAEVIFYLQT